MMNNSKVSIVTIVYNDATGIRKTIESVLNQTLAVDEYVVIDGGSKDGTKEIIEEYKDDINYFISEPDAGIYDAMNKGWKLCKKENYILFCNSSDFLESDAIKAFSIYAQSNQEQSDIYHGMLKFLKNQKLLYIQGRTSEMLKTCMIEHPASFVKKRVFEQLSGFDLHYKSASDYDFMLRAQQAGFKFSFFENIINNFDTSGISSSSNRGQLESLHIKNKYGLLSTHEYKLRTFAAKISNSIKRAIR
ncbi:glycosyltransferase family 2 protein [Pseudomonas helleri]|uniref:Glycosyltransferase n=1 Tax=Pseudomonas helleri TaxID=1608996 RepID=A0A7X1Y8Q5_9PSED|nr:glycosyltransferase family 2 protein [Pseudomonas helleri]MQT95702.1 glycosyltransferase [Pseudomonas helleri]MQU31303.1 glycosyltransferase [Pseudomonas helleri]